MKKLDFDEKIEILKIIGSIIGISGIIILTLVMVEAMKSCYI